MSDKDHAAAGVPPTGPASPPDAALHPQAPAGEVPRKPLSPAAERALAEAAARRAEIDRKTAERPPEINGRGGLEPARYGDWEIKGIAADF
jgi:hypothetical protein